MRLIVTGDVNRPGQQLNILALFGKLAFILEDAFGIRPELVIGEPVSFEAWVERYEFGPYPVDGDVLIGYELPPYAKRTVERWIDIRTHPIRFPGMGLYGIRSNIPGVEEAAEAIEVWIPQARTGPKVDGLGCVTLQVNSDAALILGGRFIEPDHVRPALQRWAAGFERVEVVPHPLEPVAVWMPPVLEYLPNAVPVEPGAYPAMMRAKAMATVSSSTGIEAPFFDCVPTFVGYEPDNPAPVILDSPDMWQAIAKTVKS